MKTTIKAAIAVLTLSLGAFSSAQNIRVEVDGNALIFANTQPQYINGRVLVPMRRIFEQLGAQVSWDRATQQVHAEKEGTAIDLTIGNRHAMIKGNPVNLDVPPMVINGSTMVPIRFVSEAMGAQVGWLEAKHLVTIDTGTTATVVEPPRRLRDVLVPAAATFTLTLDHRLDSQVNQRGDTFSATIGGGDMPASIDLPSGTKVEGHVSAIRRHTSQHKAMMDLAIDSIVLPSGKSIHFDATVIRIEDQDLMISRDGTFVSGTNFRIAAGTVIEVRARHSVRRD